VQRQAAEAFGDLVPTGPMPTVEQVEQVQALARILVQADPMMLAGSLAACLLSTYGKAAPVIARRMVEWKPAT
jgi:hypothetical protein